MWFKSLNVNGILTALSAILKIPCFLVIRRFYCKACQKSKLSVKCLLVVVSCKNSNFTRFQLNILYILVKQITCIISIKSIKSRDQEMIYNYN